MSKPQSAKNRSAMILAAGFGKRLLPLTKTTPKALIKVGGEPLIVHQINRLSKAGIDQIVINLGHLGHQIQQYLGDGRGLGVNIVYSHEDPPLETAGGIIKALPLLGTEPFVVVSADIYTDFPYKHLPAKPSGLAHLVFVDNPTWHPSGDFGLIDQLRVSNKSKLTYTFANIGVYSPQFFDGVPAGILPLGPLLRQATDKEQVTAEHYQGMWYNIGTVKELKKLQCLLSG